MSDADVGIASDPHHDAARFEAAAGGLCPADASGPPAPEADTTIAHAPGGASRERPRRLQRTTIGASDRRAQVPRLRAFFDWTSEVFGRRVVLAGSPSL